MVIKRLRKSYTTALQTNKSIKIGEKMFHYLDIGQGEPVILIHGWVDLKDNWKYNIQPLAQSYRVITFDLPGCNNTQAFSAATLEGYIGFLEAFIKATKLSSFHLIGQSLGASVVAHYTLKHPSHVKSLTLVSMILKPSNILKKLFSSIIFKGRYNRFFQSRISKLKSTERYVNFINNLVSLESIPHYQEVRAITKAGLHKSSPLAYIEGYASILTLEPQKTLEKLLHQNVPFLLIYGAQDKVVGIKHVQKLESIHGKYILLNHAGHCVNRERPQDFNTIILNRLSKVTSKKVP